MGAAGGYGMLMGRLLGMGMHLCRERFCVARGYSYRLTCLREEVDSQEREANEKGR
jgi:hypothetical protein